MKIYAATSMGLISNEEPDPQVVAIDAIQKSIAANNKDIREANQQLVKMVADDAGFWARQEVKDRINHLYANAESLNRQLERWDY